MKRISLSHVLALAALFMACSGCSVLKPRADLTKFYVLRAQPGGEPAAVAASAPVTEVRVGPGRIPGYLRSTMVALDADAGGNRLEYLDIHRWAEPLDNGLARVLGEDLASRRKIRQLTVYPDPAVEATGYDVPYTVNRFEGTMDGPVTLEVSWQVLERPSLKQVAGARSVYTVPVGDNGKDVPGYVDRMSQAIAQWADEVAAAIPSH